MVSVISFALTRPGHAVDVFPDAANLFPYPAVKVIYSAPMINLSFFTDLMVLPLRAILFVPSIVQGPSRQKLLRSIWNVTGTIEDAVRLLNTYYPHEKSEGRAVLEQLSTGSRDCGHVALLCDLDFRSFHDDAFISMWIDRARKEEYRNQPMLSYLELLICDPQSDARRALELSGLILDRGDFPPVVSYTALYNRLLAYISLGMLEEAKSIADQVCSIREDNNSLYLQMILRYARGETDMDDLAKRMQFRDDRHKNVVFAMARKAGSMEAADDI